MEYHVEAAYLPGHGDHPEVLATAGDVDGFFDRLLATPVQYRLARLHLRERPLLAGGFPDHEFFVGVDPDRTIGVLRFADAGGNWVSRHPDGGLDEITRYCLQYTDTEFPEHSDLPIDLVRAAVKEFLSSGGRRPTCVPWQVDDLV